VPSLGRAFEFFFQTDCGPDPAPGGGAMSRRDGVGDGGRLVSFRESAALPGLATAGSSGVQGGRDLGETGGLAVGPRHAEREEADMRRTGRGWLAVMAAVGLAWIAGGFTRADEAVPSDPQPRWWRNADAS
jgi:hypothetical protein